MEKNYKLNQIVYISIPENISHKIGTLDLDPSVLIPIEIPEGVDPSSWKSEDLSWEMIISGMLKVLAYDPENENLPYYRNFIHSSKPDITAELTQSAIIKAQSSDFDLAEEIFLALIGLNPQDIRSHLNLVLLYENKLGEIKDKFSAPYVELENQIESLYANLIEQAEDLPDIYFNAAWFYYNKQDFKRSYELSSSYLSMGEDEQKRSEAEKLMRECSELKDTNEIYRSAYRLVSEDKNQEGLDLIDQFLNENKNVWNAWFLKGWALRKMSQFEEGLLSFKQAAELKGPHPDILNELAICSLELGNYDESRKYLEEALSLDAENLKIISNMGILSLKEKKMEEASAFFRTVIALDPEDTIAAEYLNFIEKKSEQT
ncbi:tetratricopeptide repeat protein [Oceanispirochaeta crateris]|uniref:Tetratricopeptide repeat protein n=1 Tax=Oceanispirochaeta crateris TaxID=2518645 RepID=A0A5C1QKT4_9SPIO|nr:tetratricopeptide repeat protein [Oceanispirochaeta crateris]QEN07214.1 tetratricopeptide repeat protein [Oceanispirochaeta crateris]